MKRTRPNHIWENLSDEDFLEKLGAVNLGADGKPHPTAAGLLMFGRLDEIIKLYPDYYLDYREETDETKEWTDRVSTAMGSWSGNVLDFYFLVSSKLRHFPDAINKAVSEALANCLINADYYGRKGLVILRKKNLIVMSNPGDFRVDPAAARAGGLSDPRNGLLMKMFSLIDASSQTGSGIPGILYAWKMQGWSEPTITQSFDPNRVQLSLPLEKTAERKNFVKHADNRDLFETSARKDMIISYLTEHISATGDELCGLLNIKSPLLGGLLQELIDEEIVVKNEDRSSVTYKLKA
jgi:predicted HTH transcriptional regulator